VDMIGDRDLQIIDEFSSSAQLRTLVRKAAAELGYSKQFSGAGQALEDDHMPFIRKGVNAIDLIDFDYGPNHSWWHTPQDTMDKLNAKSFQAVGDVLIEAFKRLQQ
jgi:glutaminyl-peptide cyclotransferase